MKETFGFYRWNNKNTRWGIQLGTVLINDYFCYQWFIYKFASNYWNFWEQKHVDNTQKKKSAFQNLKSILPQAYPFCLNRLTAVHPFQPINVKKYQYTDFVSYKPKLEWKKIILDPMIWWHFFSLLVFFLFIPTEHNLFYSAQKFSYPRWKYFALFQSSCT